MAIRYISPNAKRLVADRDYAMVARRKDRKGNFIHVDPPATLLSDESLGLFEQVRRDLGKTLATGAKATVPLYD